MQFNKYIHTYIHTFIDCDWLREVLLKNIFSLITPRSGTIIVGIRTHTFTVPINSGSRKREAHKYWSMCMYDHTYSKSTDQPGKVANPARGQLNREHEYFPCPRLRLRACWSRETGLAVVPSRVSLLISKLKLNPMFT